MRKIILSVVILGSVATASLSAASTGAPGVRATRWVPDVAHTEIRFSVSHFFTPVTGSFDDFELTLEYDADNPSNSRVEARIAVASVNTGKDRRDHIARTELDPAFADHAWKGAEVVSRA